MFGGNGKIPVDDVAGGRRPRMADTSHASILLHSSAHISLRSALEVRVSWLVVHGLSIHDEALNRNEHLHEWSCSNLIWSEGKDVLLRAHAGKPKGVPVTQQRQCTQPYMYLGLGATVVWVQLMEVLPWWYPALCDVQ